MNKREFIKSASALGGLGLLPFSGTMATSLFHQNKSFKFWMWINGDARKSTRKWKKELERLKAAGVDAILPSGGKAVLENIIPAAQELEIEVHAWMWTLNRSGDEEAKKHPDWYAVNRRGQSCFDHHPYVDYYQWVCPSKPEVQAYIAQQVAELASIEGVASVHLDYVRYCDVILAKGLWDKYGLVQDREFAEFDYCYCDTCRANFKEQSGIDPWNLKIPAENEAWKQYRYDSVTRLVNKLSQVAHSHGNKITAAVFPYPDLARKLVRQSWNDWDLDAVLPMIYQSFYEKDIAWIGEATRKGVHDLNGKFPLHAGLFLPALNPNELKKAVQAALGNGAKGISLFSADGFSEDHARVMAQLKEM